LSTACDHGASQRSQFGETDLVSRPRAVLVGRPAEGRLRGRIEMIRPVERADLFIGRAVAGARNLEHALPDASTGTQPAVGTGNAAGQQGVEHGAFMIDDVSDHGRQGVVVIPVEESIWIGARDSFSGVRDPIERDLRWRCFGGIGMGWRCRGLTSKDFFDVLRSSVGRGFQRVRCRIQDWGHFFFVRLRR